MDQPRLVVVSGLIGAGKSTLTKALADRLGYRAIYEPVESNPYLARFYDDPKTWAYPMQEFLRGRRFAAYQFAHWGIRHGEFPGVVLDRSIHEDSIFAEVNAELGAIHDLNWRTYVRGFQDLAVFLPEPDLYLYLDAPPEVCHARMEARRRPEEAGVPLDYLRRLHEGYERWIEAISPRVPLVRVPWSEFRSTDAAWDEALKGLRARSRFTRQLGPPEPRPEQEGASR